MGHTAQPTCLVCGATLPLRDKGQHTYGVSNVSGLISSSAKSEKVAGWLKGELQPPK